MKTVILLSTFLTLVFSNFVYANEAKCKFYDVVCKAQKFTADTKEYQKKQWKSAGGGLKDGAKKIKDKIGVGVGLKK